MTATFINYHRLPRSTVYNVTVFVYSHVVGDDLKNGFLQLFSVPSAMQRKQREVSAISNLTD